MSRADMYDCIVVGYGPTGSTLVNLLGGAGVRMLVLEKALQTYPLPRAVHFDDETMRVFQAAGCAAEVATVVRINPGMKFVSKDGTMLLDWPRPLVITSNGFNASFRFHQPDLEGILQRRVATELSGMVTVLRGAEVTAIDDAEAGGHVSVRYDLAAAGGGTATATAKYVVGCDGANSVVRRLMPAPAPAMEDLGFQERWIVVDATLTRPMPELGDHTVQTCDPARPCTYTRQPGNRRRWEAAILPTETDADVTDPAWVWGKLLGRSGVTPADAELERVAVYTFESKVANHWRHGRQFIAGDAAHLTPPFMGQGMCAGIRDASNLAWKLALCIKHGHDDRLLGSYQSERRPHARSYIETAIKLGELMNSCQTAAELKNCLQPPSPKDGAKMKSIKPPIGPGLGVGPLAGMLCPQPQLPGGGWLDDVLGYAPVVLVDRDFFAAERSWAAPKLAALGITAFSQDEAPAVDGVLRELEVSAVLVRPDRYILATASSRDELQALVKAAWRSPAQ